MRIHLPNIFGTEQATVNSMVQTIASRKISRSRSIPALSVIEISDSSEVTIMLFPHILVAIWADWAATHMPAPPPNYGAKYLQHVYESVFIDFVIGQVPHRGLPSYSALAGSSSYRRHTFTGRDRDNGAPAGPLM